VGTDCGVYVTTNGGQSWDYLGGGLPNVPVWDIQIQARDRMMVIATYGRGIWVIDDLSPLEK